MTAIEFNHIGKQYALGTIGTGTLSHDLNRWWASIRGKEDPYLKIGEENDRTKKSDSGFVWALKDIDFKVEQGEVLGIIGKNGAGKSTLLKILSRVTSPTTGSIKARGRIASLLEVGTGFHPEMTGRENIFMNGSIMGMTKAEIKSKLDEIVDFAGVAKYLDTPVKRYSSGMMVRLGFAIAAHLEPEILVVDEVLAVGDAEFQKKAIGKMRDVSKGEGRTVLFVSHNMNAVKMLCKKGIILQNGRVTHQGTAIECVDYYIAGNTLDTNITLCKVTENHRRDNHWFKRDVEFLELAIINSNPNAMATDDTLQIRAKLFHNNKLLNKFQICIVILNSEDIRVAFYLSQEIHIDTNNDILEYIIKIPYIGLGKGKYRIQVEANILNFNEGCQPIDHIFNALSFDIKYVHGQLQDEYLHWNPQWGMTCRMDNQIEVQKIK